MVSWDVVIQKGYYWGPLVFLLIAEHFLLTYRYKKPSSLSRLLTMKTASSRTDGTFFILYYWLFGWIHTALRWLVLPGIAYAGLLWVTKNVEWSGMLQDVVPKTGILGVVCWVILLDIAVYSAHVAMHKVSLFWRFHRLHHSATEFNILTGMRISLAEKFTYDIFIIGIMSILFGIPSSAVTLGVLFVRKFIDIIQHSDLPWDYGPFRFVFCSPRYHRMHHSSEAEDHDANYGDIFVFWDYLFGTVAPRWRRDRTIADKVGLGLCSAEETADVNRSLPALMRETAIHHAWIGARWATRPIRERFGKRRPAAAEAGILAKPVRNSVAKAGADTLAEKVDPVCRPQVQKRELNSGLVREERR